MLKGKVNSLVVSLTTTMKTPPSTKTLQRYLQVGPPLNPRTSSRELMTALGDLAKCPDEIERLCDQLWDSTESNPNRMKEVWYGIVPTQEKRPYASIDLVNVERGPRNEISGSMRRLSPSDECGLTWRMQGHSHDDAIFLTFHPDTSKNAASVGATSILRYGYRESEYRGSYIRLSSNRHMEEGLVTRQYAWVKRCPQSALEMVALLDWDNTLQAGWSILPWLEYLATLSDQSIYAREAIEDLTNKYELKLIDHDELSRTCAAAYGELLTGMSVPDVADLANKYLNNHSPQDPFPFTDRLLSVLRAHGIAPIIVSGAPKELVDGISTRLNIQEYYCLEIDSQGGMYTGSIKTNAGLREAKSAIVAGIERSWRSVVLALGDSESDIPMLDGAKRRVIVGELAAQAHWTSQTTLRLIPERYTEADFREWLDSNLPSIQVDDIED
jgi:HAD superfamily phosphoserine phosphatase-like hydrolase